MKYDGASGLIDWRKMIAQVETERTRTQHKIYWCWVLCCLTDKSPETLDNSFYAVAIEIAAGRTKSTCVD